jgi:hypothetical protein
MSRRYYSSRKDKVRLSLRELYVKLQNLYLFFRDKDYFKEKAGITQHDLPSAIQHEAGIELNFQPFPITKWSVAELTEDHVFDTLEFLYDRASRPGHWSRMTNDTGWNYEDYEDYDTEAGRTDFREKANLFLADYGDGFELTEQGTILALGSHGLEQILDAEIPSYDEVNVDSKVRDAITKWRNRKLSLQEKKAAIRELADVFEWLKKTKTSRQSSIWPITLRFGITIQNRRRTMIRQFGIRGSSTSISQPIMPQFTF